MNTKFLLEERDLKAAQTFCENIRNNELRNRCTATALAAGVAKKFFNEAGLSVDTECCLFNTEDIAKEYELSDIYVNGNYVDIRVYFDEKEICVPKQHFDNEMLPLSYMFIKLSSDLSTADVTGFILPDTVTRISDTDGYYTINENVLVPFEEIDYLFKDADDLYNVDDTEIFDFADGKTQKLTAFIKKLMASQDGRRRLNKLIRAGLILTEINIEDESENTTDDDNADFDNLTDFDNILLNSEENSNYAENSSFEYTTVAMPNLPEETDEIEEIEETEETEDFSEQQELPEDNFEENTAEEAASEPLEDTEETEAVENENNDAQDDIEALFGEEEENQDEIAPKEPRNTKAPSLLIMLAVLAIIGGSAYFGYTKFSQQAQSEVSNEISDTAPVRNNDSSDEQSEITEAMPIESIEKKQTSDSINEGTSVSIPAIEQNLDASILVSNLKVEFDVPSGYASNTSAIRYLTKLGKIVQLNLKTELLLLNKPPITNRIAVELKYNDSTKSFEAVGITTSSGEKSVDDVIMQTVEKALKTKLNINTDSFEKLSGNPILIIRL